MNFEVLHDYLSFILLCGANLPRENVSTVESEKGIEIVFTIGR